ncbi:MAG TPA: DUF2085 domain-containing protein [Chloroflexi bacterium]|nr:DUF2085 domain-containing protein [Chloroflexota bacterium]
MTGPPQPSVEEILEEVERRRAARRAPRPLSATDRLVLWMAHHWLALFNLAAFLYVGLPFLAPVLMRTGAEGPAQVIYAMYRPLCHQLPYRSWYLFGEQAAYTYDELARRVGEDELVPHGLIGNPQIGYKVAICQRDTAIYGSILLAGLAYGLSRRRWPPLPFWAYILFGVVPIGLDGGIQLLSYILDFFIPGFPLGPLESTPLRRTITGLLFGVASVWLTYPRLDEVASEIRKEAARRMGNTESVFG